MQRLSLFCLWAVLLAACSKPLSPEELAKKAAQQAASESYTHLLAGRYDQFLAGRVGADSMPASYREQLTTAYKQFMAEQHTAHQGIASFTVSNARIDSSQNLVQVFLVLQYGDATQEEIVVPMVQEGERWKMK